MYDSFRRNSAEMSAQKFLCYIIITQTSAQNDAISPTKMQIALCHIWREWVIVNDGIIAESLILHLIISSFQVFEQKMPMYAH